MTEQPLPPGRLRLDRRTLLAGAAATAFLAACGGGDGDGGDAASTDDGDTAASTPPLGTWVVVQRFPQDKQEPGTLRLPFSLTDATGAPVVDPPAVLGAIVTDLDGNTLGERVTATRRDLDPTPYYPFRVDVAEPGFYNLVIDGGPPVGAAFQVMEPGSVPVTGAGAPLPPFDTPTVDDGRGVDPVCTRQDPCPFHDVTLADALGAGTPVVYVIGTPAFCQTGVCAPALDEVIDLHGRYPGVTFVHAEVYADNTATTLAPAIEAAQLSFEPVLWVTDADGVVVERLDAIWDGSEVAEILDRVSG